MKKDGSKTFIECVARAATAQSKIGKSLRAFNSKNFFNTSKNGT